MLLKTYEQTFPASASISYFGRQLIFKAAKNVDVVVVSWCRGQYCQLSVFTVVDFVNVHPREVLDEVRMHCLMLVIHASGHLCLL